MESQGTSSAAERGILRGKQSPAGFPIPEKRAGSQPAAIENDRLRQRHYLCGTRKGPHLNLASAIAKGIHQSPEVDRWFDQHGIKSPGIPCRKNMLAGCKIAEAHLEITQHSARSTDPSILRRLLAEIIIGQPPHTLLRRKGFGPAAVVEYGERPPLSAGHTGGRSLA